MERPLSPFMFPAWYRFQITSVLSILHRLTGIALVVGSILLAWWLVEAVMANTRSLSNATALRDENVLRRVRHLGSARDGLAEWRV